MAKFKPANYLEKQKFPEVDKKFETELLQNELARISRGEKMKEMDESRYALPNVEVSNFKSIGEINKYISKSQILMQHNNVRTLNLELL